jgi:hypothetical protein
MSARLRHFDPKAGGGYGMVLHYDEGAPAPAGKTRAHDDEVEVKFLEFRPEECVVEEVHFISTDPAFAEPMRLTTTFEKDRDGTRVTLRAENVPSPISTKDQKADMLSSLGQLARLTE